MYKKIHYNIVHNSKTLKRTYIFNNNDGLNRGTAIQQKNTQPIKIMR